MTYYCRHCGVPKETALLRPIRLSEALGRANPARFTADREDRLKCPDCHMTMSRKQPRKHHPYEFGMATTLTDKRGMTSSCANYHHYRCKGRQTVKTTGKPCMCWCHKKASAHA